MVQIGKGFVIVPYQGTDSIIFIIFFNFSFVLFVTLNCALVGGAIFRGFGFCSTLVIGLFHIFVDNCLLTTILIK